MPRRAHPVMLIAATSQLNRRNALLCLAGPSCDEMTSHRQLNLIMYFRAGRADLAKARSLYLYIIILYRAPSILTGDTRKIFVSRPSTSLVLSNSARVLIADRL